MTLIFLFVFIAVVHFDVSAAIWTNNTIGLPMRVIKPWTPLQCGTKSVSAWGRTYQWQNGSLLPSSIISGNDELLAGPMLIFATINGVSQSFPLNNFTFTQQADERVVITAQSIINSITVNAAFTIDFDGFVWCVLNFSEPAGTTQISDLRIDVPVQRNKVKYYQDNTSTGFGSIPANANVNFGWVTGATGEYRNFYHWFGDEEKGLGFAYRSLQYWKPITNTNFCTFLSRPTTATYRINLLQSPALANGLVYEFGIQATPIKPLVPDYHSMLGDTMVYGIASQIGDYVDIIAMMPQVENNGAGCDIFPGLNDPENWSSCLNNPVSTCHSTGQAVGVALCPQKLSAQNNYLNSYLSEWKVIPEQSLDWDGIANYDNCPASADLVNYFVYQWKQRILQYNLDGIYFDGWLGAWPCKNEVHGCGYIDGQGNRQEIVPILEARTAMMRVATMLEDTINSNYVPVTYSPNKPDFPNYYFMVHSWTTVPPIMGFATSWLTGEYLWSDVVGNHSASYAQLLGVDKLRARSISNNWGVPNFWDAVISDTLDGHLTKMVFAWMLPHGEPIFYLSMMNSPLTINVYNIMKEFETRKAMFTPAWKSNSYLEVTSPISQNILTATWEADYQVLAVVSNIDGSNSAAITLKWNKASNPIIVDALTGEKIPYNQTSKTFQVSIAKEDFRLLKFTHSADLDNDEDVDFSDLAILVDQWLIDGTADFNGDNDVDFSDFAFLVSKWTGPISPIDRALIFAARYNNGLDADISNGDAVAIVTHGAGPDVGLSADGTGVFAGSTPNKALTQTVGYAHSSIVNTGEKVTYQSENNISLETGTFVGWVKASGSERFFVPAEGMIFAENGHWTSNNSITLYDQYTYGYQRQYVFAGKDAYGNYFAVDTVSTSANKGFDEWVFVAASWSVSVDGNLSLKIYARSIGQSSFATGTSSYSDIDFTEVAGPLTIGSDSWGSRIYGGLVDDVQIYNRALTDEEIESIYSSGNER